MAINVAGAGAACRFMSGTFTFMKASDNRLWTSWLSPYGTDSNWLSLTTGEIGQVIDAVASGPFLFCFFQATDNTLGCSFYNNVSVNWTTVNLGKPSGAVTIAAPPPRTIRSASDTLLPPAPLNSFWIASSFCNAVLSWAG